MSNRWFEKNVTKRKLIRKSEDRISYVQIIGFVLIAAGVLYMTAYRLIYHISSPEGMAISFFIIMLGMSLAFPSLLEGPDKELSTMRIVVFMMVNVICLLLIKIGWDPGVHSLKQIGLDQFWMGVIAFVFGAKATQSYFESKMAVPPKGDTDTPSTTLTGHQSAQKAIDANSDLNTKYPNIVKLIPSYCLNEDNERIPCVDVCISDNNGSKIPASLNYKDDDGSQVNIRTRVIANYANAKPQVGRGDFICNDNSHNEVGTVCCLTDSGASSDRYLLTCNHVMTGGDFESPGHVGGKAVEFIFGDDFEDIGIWKEGKMDNTVDVAAIRVNNGARKHSNDIQTSIYDVTEDDCSHTIVELKGAISKTKQATIIHISQSIGIDYNHGRTVTMQGLITISTSAVGSNFSPVTKKGDSGSLVYHAKTRQPIGMVVGANTQFTFVIPMQAILNAFPALKLKISNH